MVKNKARIPLTIGILTKDSAESLLKTLQSVRFAEEIIVVDNGSTDDTLKIAKKFTKSIFPSSSNSFAEKRNVVLEKATYPWIFYLDADEVVTPNLRMEIAQVVKDDLPKAYFVKRQNYFLGTLMYPDEVERLFHKEVLQHWEGRVHEHPVLTQAADRLSSPLNHFTHTTITAMLTKTNHWSETEAQLRLTANHPSMTWWRLPRIALTYFWQQFIKLKVWRYGRNGIFEGYYQIIDKLIVYVKLWEKQQTKRVTHEV